MPWIILLFAILALVFGPSLWVKRVMSRYSQPADRYKGSGSELARALLDDLGLHRVGVEMTEQGDHYDPRDKVVRLTAENFEGHSLTAVTVSAHEVGHAVQDAEAFPPLRIRTRLVGMTRHVERIGAGILMMAPVMGLLTRAPAISLLMILGGFMSLGAATLVHLVTLPTEWDASFRRALPLLENGSYLKPVDMPHARRLLRAAALTYVSVSLMSLLNIARWWALLRR
jgi:Zn-dependent membrane protease YugP